MPNNLTGQNISDTYQRLLQIEGGVLTDGTGSAVIVPSASFAISSSHEIIKELSSSYAETASMASSNFIIQGHLTASGNISASGGTVTALSGSFNHIITDGNTIEFRNATTGNKEGILKFDSSTGLQIGDDSTGNADLKANTITAVSKFVSDGTAEFESNVTMSGNFSASGKILTSQIITNGINTVTPDGDTLVFGSDSNAASLRGSSISLGSTAAHHVTASGNVSVSGDIEVRNVTASGQISASGTGDHYLGGDVRLDSGAKIFGGGSHIDFDATGIEIYTSVNTVKFKNGETVFNDGHHASQDFRVEGDSKTHLLFVDANEEKVGIGRSGQLTSVDSTLDVTGDLAVSSHITASGNISASIGSFIQTPEIRGTGTATAQLHVEGQITASGNISSSSTIIANIISGSIISGSFVGDGSGITNLVTTTNVTNAGALMDSEVDADIKTLSLPADTTISTFGASLIDDAAASNARTTLGLGTAATTAASDYATAAQGSKADSAQQPPSEGAFANGDKTKLDALVLTTRAAITGSSTSLSSSIASNIAVNTLKLTADATNVANAGALMDSELSDIAAIKAINQGLTTTSNVLFGNISASGYITSSGVIINPGSATQAAIQSSIKKGDYSLFVGSGSVNTNALFYSDTGNTNLQIRSNTGNNASILFNEDGSARYIMGTYGTDDSFQLRNSSFMTGGDQLVKLSFDGSGIQLGHDLGFHVTASGQISASGNITAPSYTGQIVALDRLNYYITIDSTNYFLGRNTGIEGGDFNVDFTTPFTIDDEDVYFANLLPVSMSTIGLRSGIRVSGGGNCQIWVTTGSRSDWPTANTVPLGFGASGSVFLSDGQDFATLDIPEFPIGEECDAVYIFVRSPDGDDPSIRVTGQLYGRTR